MAEYQPKPGEFSLFPATPDEQERVSKDLVMSGQGVALNGEECWVSIFRATRKDDTLVKTKDGKQVYNMKLKPKQAKGGGGENAYSFDAGRKVEPDPFEDDHVPF